MNYIDYYVFVLKMNSGMAYFLLPGKQYNLVTLKK
jgi:hypothetical protein